MACSAPDGQIVKVDLLEQDIVCFHLASVSAVTWFSGDSLKTEAFLRKRVARIVELNPWLTGRLVTSKNEKNDLFSRFFTRRLRMQLLYDPNNGAAVDCFSVCDDPSIDEEIPYQQNHVCFAPYTVPNGKETVDVLPSPSLYRVTLVRISETRFAVIDSISHMIADGHTFYKLHGMLSTSNQPAALVVERCKFYKQLKDRAISGDDEKKLSHCILPIVWNLIFGSACVTIQAVSHGWIERERKNASDENPGASVSLSTNDLLMSFICNNGQPDLAFMSINMRGRVPDITPDHAGNYSPVILFQQNDYRSPTLFRRAVSAAPIQRVFHDQPLPGAIIWNRLWPRLCRLTLVTNWVSLYEDISMPGSNLTRHQPLLGRPPQKSRSCKGGPFQCMFDVAIIYRPRKNSIAVMYIGSHASMTAEKLKRLGEL